MPRVPAPMLASPAGDLPPLEGWTIEPKWDGVRVIADVTPHAARLWSRNGIDKAAQFPMVSKALVALASEKGPLTLDGELVAVDRAGKALRFQALQGRHLKGAAASHTAFVAFDVLTADGTSLTRAPWTERRRALESLVPKSKRGIIRLGESYPCGSAGAARLFAAARREGWEGLLLKRTDGLRDDKDARDVRLEAETSHGAILDTLRCAS